MKRILLIGAALMTANCSKGVSAPANDACAEQVNTLSDSLGSADVKKICSCSFKKVADEVGAKEFSSWQDTYVQAWSAKKQGATKIDGVDGGRTALATMSWQIKLCGGL